MKTLSTTTATIFRRLWALGFALMVMSVALSAQNAEVEPLRHTLKVYQDAESQQLFWPQDLPVHVWLSTSADQNAPKHRLDTARLKNQEGYEDLEQTSIDLELSGNQYLRWINYETKDTVMLQFQADGVAPESEITLQGAPEYQSETVNYKGQGLQANFEAEDALSGVANIYVSVNGAEFSPSFGVYDFNQEKEYDVFYYAVDNVGNVEGVQHQKFSVDLSSPVTRHQIEGIHQGSILSPEATILLTSNDELSGVASTNYGFSESQSQPYKVAISVASLDDGNHTLYYSSADQVQNEEENNRFEFYVDKTPPVTQLQIDGDQYEGENLFVSERTEFHLSVQDNKTGISATSYQVNDRPEQAYENSVIRLPAESGEYELRFWSVDNVQNEEARSSQLLYVDLPPPVSRHLFNGDSFTQRGKTWIPSSTSISLQAEDTEAGVGDIFYAQGEESSAQVYEQPLSFSNEGEVELVYYAKDRVNNKETNQRLQLVIDNTAPQISVNFSSSKIGSANAEDGSVLDEYPVGTVVFLAATDAASGAETIRFSVNDGEAQPFASPLEFQEPGEQIVEIQAVDRVGNEASKTLRFIISE